MMEMIRNTSDPDFKLEWFWKWFIDQGFKDEHWEHAPIGDKLDVILIAKDALPAMKTNVTVLELLVLECKWSHWRPTKFKGEK